MSARKAAFTDLYVRNVKATSERQEIPDPGQANLYLVVQPSGRRGFAVRYRFKGEPRKMTLVSGISLADARIATTKAMAKISEGIDPIEERKADEAAAAATTENTVQSVAENYMRQAGDKLRSRRDRQSILDRLVYPRLGKRPIGEIERDDITALLDKIASENGPRAADMTLSVLRRIFSWHEARTSKFRSPIVRGMARLKPAERARKRILTDDEIRRVWEASGDRRLGLFGLCIRFLLLTSARRNEASCMEHAEIRKMRDDTKVERTVWVLPAARSKTKDDVVRPLSPTAMVVLNEVPQIAESKYVFTADGKRPIRLNGKRKSLLDEISGTNGWIIHDLRRTSRTLLARARVPYDIAEQCLGHKLKGGLIRETYDQHSYLEDRAEAFEKLAAQVEQILHPPPEGKKVVRLVR